MFSIFKPTAISKRRSESKSRYLKGPSKRDGESNVANLYRHVYDAPIHTTSLWNELPVELQIKIISLCGVWDFLPLKLVCRGFFELLTINEQSIAKEYLRHRRHGTLPSTSTEQRQYTRNPEDDVVLLSDLFPPSKSAKGGHLYTFRYLHRLRRRQEHCGRLAYYLADRVVKRFVQTQQDFVKTQCPTKSERHIFYKRGVASFKFNLIPVMFVLCSLPTFDIRD